VSKQELSPVYKFSILSIPATMLIMAPNFADPINLPKLLALSIFAFVALTLFIVLRQYTHIRPKFSLEGKVLNTAYCLIGLAMVTSAVSNSGNYIRNLFGTNGRSNGLIYLLSVILLALILLRLVIGELEVNYLYKVISYTSITFGIYCTFQYLSLDPIQWSNIYNRVIGTLGNPNFSSAALAIFAVFWLYWFFRSSAESGFNKLYTLIFSLIFAFLSWSTESLQGVTIVAAGIALILFIALREKYSSGFLPYLLFFGGSVFSLFIFASFLGLGPLGTQLEQYTLKLRGFYAYFGIRAMLNSPWNGVGVDNYLSAFRSNRTQDFISEYGVGLSSNNAHSTPAQLGATFGIVVFLLYFGLQIWILFRALKVINSRDKSKYHLKGVALIWILVFSQSLLSIEIIGLAVLNWILGAVLLSAYVSSEIVTVNADRRAQVRMANKTLPAWVGSLTIAAFAIGTIPTVVISIEDKAYLNILRINVDTPESENLVREDFNKLSNFTLLESSKVSEIVVKLYQSGLAEDAEKINLRLHELNPKDPIPLVLLSAYYTNTNQLDKELEFTLKLIDLDPLNYQLEYVMARAYASKRDIPQLKKSIERIRLLAPKSQELIDAQALLNQL